MTYSDFSFTQACKALRSLGYEIVLVNSNPATITTDPGMADVTYIEPFKVQVLTDIIKTERPDALLPNLGGQSALTSKATGFPIAFISAMLAGGLTLDEIPYWHDGTLEKYTPSGDYVVVKFARGAFEKFEGVENELGIQMRAVGEAMSIGKNYKEAFQKAIRSLEINRYGLGFAKDFKEKTLTELMNMLAVLSMRLRGFTMQIENLSRLIMRILNKMNSTFYEFIDFKINLVLCLFDKYVKRFRGSEVDRLMMLAWRNQWHRKKSQHD